MEVKLSTESIRDIAAFEKITSVHARDCIIMDACIYFLVDPKKVGIAIGKNGSVIQQVRHVLGKPVKVFGYSENPEEFIRSMIPQARSIELTNGVATVAIPQRERSLIIGRGGSNINAIKAILKRHFGIGDLRLR